MTGFLPGVEGAASSEAAAVDEAFGDDAASAASDEGVAAPFPFDSVPFPAPLPLSFLAEEDDNKNEDD